MNANGLTPTQQRLYDVLADGKPHTMPELFECIDDNLGYPTKLLNTHVWYLRRKLNPRGLDVTCRSGQ